jgi:3-oxoacyl-[acyl-carrier protein] reductase
MDLGLSGRVYVVTGGSRGLGRATARLLVDEGAKVIVTGRDRSAVDEAVDALGGAGWACGVVVDNADPAAGGRVVAAATTAFGRLDGALVSGPSPRPGALADVTDDDWRGAFNTVFLGALNVGRAVGAAVGDGGSLLFLLSTTSRTPMGHLAISSGLRPGLAMVAKLLADDLGPRGVRVNSILPGRFATASLREIDNDVPRTATPRDGSRLRESSSLARDGVAEEFARQAAWLLSPASGFVTGTNVVIDGGSHRTP